MRLLLDAQMLLWSVFWPEIMSPAARDLVDDAANVLYFSPVNLWEVGIKNARGKPDFRIDARDMYERLLMSDYAEIAVLGSHTVAAGELPLIHKDPFDRLLVAQAAVENISLLTSDNKLAEYAAPVIFIPR
jgi:PIN domain nuclease of toxin-antitoxin system